MTLKKLLLFVAIVLCQLAAAQNDTIAELKEVIITDTQLRDFSNTQNVQKLNDSVIGRNAASLTSLLTYNTVIYFKENGLGMVSSPSFRGTTAQQTAVVWNGININSQLNGQTDFNTLTTRDFQSIDVRAGGGSVIYGSSAIGGSIHLNNELAFGNRFSNELRAEYGSFNTLGLNYKVNAATDKFSTQVSVSRNSSDNDYDYAGYNLKNDNGQYYNTSINAAAAYKINDKNTLRLYSYMFDGERHFSRTLAAPSRSMYRDGNTRNLLEWVSKQSAFTSKLKLAYLTEKFKYYENFRNDIFTTGEVKTWLARYDIAYDITDAVKLNAIVDYTESDGEGSGITKQKRQTGSGSLLMRHLLTPKLHYEFGVRKEVTNLYGSPVLFSAGAKYDVTHFYSIKLNASRNYRVPTFNDLYWQAGGNEDLKPETSYQAELGNEIRLGALKLTVTGYYIKLKDMLRWTPGSSQWHAENLSRVNTYGLEAVGSWQKQWGSSNIALNGTYAYTVSRQKYKTEQLIYVPLHRATASVAYSYARISAYYRHLFNGEVFTTSDNSSAIDPYNVSSVGAEYHFKLLKGLTIGAQVLNLWNEEYQNVAMRPLPGRNYTMYLNFKF